MWIHAREEKNKKMKRLIIMVLVVCTIGAAFVGSIHLKNEHTRQLWALEVAENQEIIRHNKAMKRERAISDCLDVRVHLEGCEARQDAKEKK
jgi:hypothetical protein